MSWLSADGRLERVALDVVDLRPVVGHERRSDEAVGRGLATIVKYIFQFLYRTAEGVAPEK